MVGWNKINHFRELSDYREFLIRVMKVNSPYTNIPQPHVVHKNSIV